MRGKASTVSLERVVIGVVKLWIRVAMALESRRCGCAGLGDCCAGQSLRQSGRGRLCLALAIAERAAQLVNSLPACGVGGEACARTAPGVQHGRVIAPAEVATDRRQ